MSPPSPIVISSDDEVFLSFPSPKSAGGSKIPRSQTTLNPFNAKQATAQAINIATTSDKQTKKVRIVYQVLLQDR
jgi:hypothetical protein